MKILTYVEILYLNFVLFFKKSTLIFIKIFKIFYLTLHTVVYHVKSITYLTHVCKV